MIALFIRFRDEETANLGVQTAHITENSNIPLPPYTIMSVDNSYKV